MRRCRGGAALVAVLALALPAQALETGRTAPAFAATTLDGTRFDLAAHRGEVVLLNFWASWCAPCREEMPAFDAYYRAHRDEGLAIVTVSMDDPERRATVERIARGFAFPSAMAGDAQAAGYGRIWRLPISFVIDRRGVLRVDGGRGERKAYDGPALDRELGPLLREPRPDPLRTRD